MLRAPDREKEEASKHQSTHDPSETPPCTQSPGTAGWDKCLNHSRHVGSEGADGLHPTASQAQPGPQTSLLAL